MSERDLRTRGDEDLPAFEPWLRVLTMVFIPMALVLVVPPTFMWLLLAAAGAIFALSMLMLYRQERAKRLARHSVDIR